MKIIVIIVGLVLVVFFALGWVSKRQAPLAISATSKMLCSDKPNCVSSGSQVDDPHYIAPLNLAGNDQQDFAQAVARAIEQMGGNIAVNDGSMIYATFTSKIFRFVDDLVITIDAQNAQAQVLSSSRVGYSDFNVNRQRVEKIRAILTAEVRTSTEGD